MALSIFRCFFFIMIAWKMAEKKVKMIKWQKWQNDNDKMTNWQNQCHHRIRQVKFFKNGLTLGSVAVIISNLIKKYLILNFVYKVHKEITRCQSGIIDFGVIPICAPITPRSRNALTDVIFWPLTRARGAEVTPRCWCTCT